MKWKPKFKDVRYQGNKTGQKIIYDGIAEKIS